MTTRLQDYNASFIEEEVINLDNIFFVNLINLQKLTEYQDVTFENINAQNVIEFENIKETEFFIILIIILINFSSRRSSIAFLSNISKTLFHQRFIHTRSDFVLTISLFCKNIRISRKH